MKHVFKLGIVLVLMVVVISCQKDEIQPLTSTESQDDGYVNPDMNDSVDPNWLDQTGVYQGGNLPTPQDTPGTYLDNTPVTADGNTRWLPPVVTWTDELPTDGKWEMYNRNYRDIANSRAVIDGPTPPCPYEDCDTAIAAAVAALQPIANAECRDIYTCVACCAGGYIAYALIVVRHNCGIIAPPSEY